VDGRTARRRARRLVPAPGAHLDRAGGGGRAPRAAAGAGSALRTGRAFDDRLRLPFALAPERLTAAIALLADVAAQVGSGTGTRGARARRPAHEITLVA
jgi:hypothetical protein